MDERDKLLTAIATLQSQRGDADTTAIDAALEALQEKLSTLDGNQKTLRQVTVLFLDLVGSTALSRELDPEDISEIVDGGLRRLSAIVCAHGGKVLQYAGDSILAVFGATTALEDDPVRAVKCGLALCRRRRRFEPEFNRAPPATRSTFESASTQARYCLGEAWMTRRRSAVSRSTSQHAWNSLHHPAACASAMKPSDMFVAFLTLATNRR